MRATRVLLNKSNLTGSAKVSPPALGSIITVDQVTLLVCRVPSRSEIDWQLGETLPVSHGLTRMISEQVTPRFIPWKICYTDKWGSGVQDKLQCLDYLGTVAKS